MGSIQPHELSLNCRPTFIPRTISEFLGQVSTIKNVKERQLKIDEYIARLDDEMRKIDAFKRELPLSMLLLNDAIVAVKEEAMQYRKVIAEPILEEFIPLKNSCDEEDKKVEVAKEKDNKEKKNWLSMQLWNSDQHCSNLNFSNSKESSKPEPVKRSEEGVNNVVSNCPFKSPGNSQSMRTAFVPFQGYTGFPLISPRKEEKEKLAGVPRLSLRTPGSKSPDDDIVSSGLNSKISANRVRSSSASSSQSSLPPGPQAQQQQTTRKQRRCWSPELHRRFVEALQQLGGSQVATPKQIRELMQVDGLTNDEVKSHLQKYRLHTRRLSTTSASATDKSALLRWNPQDNHGESSSKQSNSQTASPQDPLQFGGASRATSMTGEDSMEDEDDNKSESYSWKSHVQSSEKSNV